MAEPYDPLLDAWWRKALCSEVGTALFFMPVGDQGGEAKRVCRSCEVRVDCLADSLRFDASPGIFGGFGVVIRSRMRMRVASGEDRYTVAARAVAADTPRKKAAS